MFNRNASQMQPSPQPPAAPQQQFQPPAPPVQQQASFAPPQPPAPPAPVAEQQFWVSVNGGQAQLMPASQARALPPTTLAMRQDQQGGWIPLAALLPVAPHAPVAQQQPPQQQPYSRPPQQQQQGYASGSGATSGLFAGHDIDKAEVYQKGKPLTAGQYLLKVMNTEAIKGRQANFMCIESSVLVSSFTQDIPATHGACMVGTNVSVLIKENDSFASNMKEIILALSGYDNQGNPRNPDGGGFNDDLKLMREGNPFAGVLVYVTAVDSQTRQGKPWTRINWYPVPMLPDGSPDMVKLQQIR